MNAADFRSAIEDSVAYAMKHEPNDIYSRARCFMAFLAGSISYDEKALADTVRTMWAPRAEAPTTPAADR